MIFISDKHSIWYTLVRKTSNRCFSFTLNKCLSEINLHFENGFYCEMISAESYF